MKKSVSWSSLALAFALVSGCANQNHWTSKVGEDSPVTAGGVRVANELPGSQGPVADNSRLAINHRDVAEREQADRARLARSAETRRRTQVTDRTFSQSSAPVAKAPAAAKRRHVGSTDHANRTRAVRTEGRSSAASMPVRVMNREVALNQLHHINQREIEVAKIAESRAATGSIKRTAARVRRDHEALERRVEQVAKAKEIPLAEYSPATYEKVRTEKLENLSGRDFDLAFAQGMKDGHRLTTAQLNILRKRVHDADVLALINRALPAVRKHEKQSGNVLSSIRTDNDYSARR